MRNAETILGIIRERGRRGLPINDLYRQLWNPDLYVLAYGRIARNGGALTPGATPETADGMSLEKIETIIEALRFERYRWTPVRRVYIEKKNSTKLRPLGIPSWSDKVLQEVIRLILEAYYEPQFRESSHGFRPARGCHSALTTIKRTWTGTVWFIEGDIKGGFDNIDLAVLLSILGEKITDRRFLRLIDQLLQAGYLEDWRWHATYSGTPQGGIVSPILANIYLDRLDRFAEDVLIPAHTQGQERRPNPEYSKIANRRNYLKRTGRPAQAKALRTLLRSLPFNYTQDPHYRRLRYIRYTDDFLLGFTGPKDEAEAIKRQVGEFLSATLKLELSTAKTLVTHGRTEAARFLGYEVVVQQSDTKCDARGRRSANGIIGLHVPPDVIRAKKASYMRGGKPNHRGILFHDSPFSIVSQYQSEFRGIANYYQFACNRGTLQSLRWAMDMSLAKTLAAKLKISTTQVFRRYKTTIQTERGPQKVLLVQVEREGRQPLVAVWGGTSLARTEMVAVPNDKLPLIRSGRTELEQRLLANTCELCGSTVGIEVHHVRALKDLNRPGRTPKSAWAVVMAARQRKTLVTCRRCHDDIHAGRPSRQLAHRG